MEPGAGSDIDTFQQAAGGGDDAAIGAGEADPGQGPEAGLQVFEQATGRGRLRRLALEGLETGDQADLTRPLGEAVIEAMRHHPAKSARRAPSSSTSRCRSDRSSRAEPARPSRAHRNPIARPYRQPGPDPPKKGHHDRTQRLYWILFIFAVSSFVHSRNERFGWRFVVRDAA
ncbi:hypothetical protein JMJ56_08715 [Belnapia sp. T18]|uniref:Uncharacterized protein n=1 Tax=Belnapia arida TaxID=2804533 RepID=A0ABS1U457_9PROT|nr:hypothetical protein [Belnapia arida]MBL6078086.1 hypothetical protein [Belnapia arida]